MSFGGGFWSLEEKGLFLAIVPVSCNASNPGLSIAILPK